ncbi:pantoate--beta-alanine ligase [Rasiella sp. SM2506]|uniref:pantoate--beta-alanine ligase n=1 Tax=Rasiella sp. SM2506 TaxID=3423914 RepID=UPI003D792EBC
MKIYHTTKRLQEILHVTPIETSIGFIPTMGALHEGHISLVERALKENTVVVVSIFVNPTQFDNEGDLSKYPRTLEEDSKLLSQTSQDIIIFAPTPAEVYGTAIKSKKYDFGKLANEMEGKHRKGHFDGVGTVLNHLFRIIEPDRAYFGEKDFQQLQIVKKLVVLENLPVTIVGCPILRETDGLAMSSRNKRLTVEQRENAVFISEILKITQQQFQEKTIEELTQFAENTFAENKHLDLEYFEIANIKNLKTAKKKKEGKKYRAFIAAFAGEVRLIDNLALN